LFRKGQYADAAPIYASLEKSKLPANPKAEALYKIGWCFMQTHEIDRAIPAFTNFLDANPTHKLVPSALAQRAIAFQQSKNFGAALKDFDELISKYPKAPERELALQ